MPQTWLRWFLTALASALLLAHPAAATEEMRGHLVSAQWLQGNRGATDLLLLDASFAQMHAAKHIPGAVNADLLSFGVQGGEHPVLCPEVHPRLPDGAALRRIAARMAAG